MPKEVTKALEKVATLFPIEAKELLEYIDKIETDLWECNMGEDL